jgi:hypothetical protein
VLETAISSAPVQQLEEDGPVWLEALPARTYKTPVYGEVPITVDKLERFVKNFNDNVRGQEIAIDFEHGQDSAKGKKAAGWYKEFDIRPSSEDASVPALFTRVEFTDEAKKEVKDKQWKYFSLDWYDEWEDTSGAKHEDVVIGGGLTNRPIAKKTMPINFSESMWDELDDEDKKRFSVMAGVRIVGEQKEWEHSEPGTGNPPEPRKDEDGSDDPAIEGGWRRSTPPDQDAPPGPGNPSSRGGNKMPEFEYAFAEKPTRELFKVLNIDKDVSEVKNDEVVEAARLMFGELDTLRKNEDATEQEKKFSEQYPQYWEEHRKLMERDRDNSAKVFSESVKTLKKAEGNGLKTMNQGLSPVALEKVQEVHKKFSEGTVSVEDFEECIKTIMSGGIYTFGEIGSSGEDDDIPEVDGTTAQGIAGARKVFAEVMNKVKSENPEWDDQKVLEEVAKKHPDLFDASRPTVGVA